MKRIILSFAIIILVMLTFVNYCYATNTIDDLGDLKNYSGEGEDSVTLQNKINPVITILQTIGSIASVVALIAIGMKYMFGSIEEKAEYKKTMIPYIIGCVIVFSISNLVGFLFNIAKDLF